MNDMENIPVCHIPLTTLLAAPSMNGSQDLAIERSVSGQGSLPDNLTQLSRGRTRLDNVVSNAVLSEDLHCPLIDNMGFRKNRSAGMSLEQDMLNTLVG